VVREEATEDIQKFGGMTALETPYLETPLRDMLRKRGGWLSVLFVGELFTATAMAYFEHEIARAVFLAVFIPLIISSGGNSGSHVTLVVRALSWGTPLATGGGGRTRDHVGLSAGMPARGPRLARVLLWQGVPQYGNQSFALALTVAVSLVGVVAFGSLAGSMLPLVLKRLGFDPAVASAPLVATLVDVSGIVIYFAAASLILLG
jgi:magnesium transporter